MLTRAEPPSNGGLLQPDRNTSTVIVSFAEMLSELVGAIDEPFLATAFRATVAAPKQVDAHKKAQAARTLDFHPNMRVITDFLGLNAGCSVQFAKIGCHNFLSFFQFFWVSDL